MPSFEGTQSNPRAGAKPGFWEALIFARRGAAALRLQCPSWLVGSRWSTEQTKGVLGASGLFVRFSLAPFGLLRIVCLVDIIIPFRIS